MLEIVASVARIAIAAYVGLCLLVYLRQSGYVYYPKPTLQFTPEDYGLPFESLTLTTSDGESLGAWYVPAGDNPREGWSLIFCHGNAGNIGDRVGSIKTFHDLGIHVLIFDYRGYGESTGKPDEAGTYQDALAAWNHLAGEKQVAPKNIVVFGRSLGGAIASWLALQHRPGLLLLESAFTSATDMAARLFPYLPTRVFSRFRYDSLERLPRLDCPVFIAHSPDDDTVPFEHASRLFEAAPSPKTFIEFSGGHNSGGMDADRTYFDAFRSFLADVNKGDST